MSVWIAIEHAPKDRPLDLWWVCPDGEALRLTDFYWQNGNWTDGYERPSITFGGAPTHYMEIPEGPT